MAVETIKVYSRHFCDNCSSRMNLWPFDSDTDNIKKCGQCGALYRITDINTGFQDRELNVYVSYKNIGFTCITKDIFNVCLNTCPEQYMFCKEHSSEEEESKVIQSIKNLECDKTKLEEKLKLIKQSRKTWIIMGLSGIDE